MRRWWAIIAIAIVALGITIFTLTRNISTATLPGAVPTTNAAWSPFPPRYSEKVQKITTLLEAAPTSQPSAVDAAELFEQVLHDPDFRIRVRAMAVLPFVREREKAIDVLIASVHNRDPETSGGGNVPLYATTYLADMAAVRAIPDITDWVEFLNSHPRYEQKMRTMILKKSTDDLARLKKMAATRPTAAAIQGSQNQGDQFNFRGGPLLLK